jgi:hypothetical protein
MVRDLFLEGGAVINHAFGLAMTAGLWAAPLTPAALRVR